MEKRVKRKAGKKAQTMSLPFTMIFAIILVAVVIFVGFFVIKMFLERTEQVEFNLLIDEIKDEVVEAWQSSESEKEIKLDCSDKVEYICFIDLSGSAKGPHSPKFNEIKNFPARNENANFFYYPLMIAERYDSFTDWYIRCGSKDCLELQDNINPLCVKVIGGKVKFTLVKEPNELVVVKP